MKINRRQWTLKDYEVYFRAGLISVEDIVDADFVRFLFIYVIFAAYLILSKLSDTFII